MGTCVAKEFKAPTVANNITTQGKEDQDHNLNGQTLGKDQFSEVKNSIEIKRRSRSTRPSTQVLVRQKCVNNIDHQIGSNSNTITNNSNTNNSEQIITSQNTIRNNTRGLSVESTRRRSPSGYSNNSHSLASISPTFSSPKMISNQNSSDSTLPSLILTSPSCNNTNVNNVKMHINNVIISGSSAPANQNRRSVIIARQNSQQPSQVFRRSSASKKTSQTVIDQSNRFQNEHSQLLFRNHSQLFSQQAIPASTNYLSLSNSPPTNPLLSNCKNTQNLNMATTTTTDTSSQSSQNTSLEDLLTMLNKQKVSQEEIISLCDSFLENKLKTFGETSQEYSEAVKNLALSLFKLQLSHLGKIYLDKLILHRKQYSQQAILKNLEDYQRKRV